MAQRGVNKVILLGNVGQDPEIRYMPSGGAVCNVTLATSETWNDKQTGEKKERTEWHRVVFMGKLAEIVGEYVSKGTKLYVEGKLQTRKWQDQSGQEKYTTEILVDGIGGVMQLLGSPNDGGGQQQQRQQPQQQQQQRQQQQAQGGYSRPQQQQQQQQQQQGGYQRPQQQQQGGQNYNEPPMDFDDDIPF